MSTIGVRNEKTKLETQLRNMLNMSYEVFEAKCLDLTGSDTTDHDELIGRIKEHFSTVKSKIDTLGMEELIALSDRTILMVTHFIRTCAVESNNTVLLEKINLLSQIHGGSLLGETVNTGSLPNASLH